MHHMRTRFRAAALLLALAIVAPVQAAEKKHPPQSRTEITLSFAPLVKRAAPAVVNIYAKRVVRERAVSPLFKDPFFRRFFGQRFSLGERQRVQNSLGSGVIVRADGLVVTNEHVIAKADAIKVVLADRREFDATVVLSDEKTDLAVLRIDTGGEALPVLSLSDSDALEVGDLVLAIGNPFGVGQTVTSGIVSATARPARGVSDFSFFIQTDAAVNPGNSGGALIAMDGRLVGINTAIYSRGGGSNGIGFAIPANMVATVIESAVKGGKVLRPWLGASGQTVDVDLARSIGLKRPVGVIISDVHKGGPADQAGLTVGDVVLAVNGQEVGDAAALRFRIATLPLGGTAALKVYRKGAERAITVALRPAPEDPPRRATELRGDHPFAGATVANLSPALIEELSFDGPQTGVIILDIAGRSPARGLGLRPHDVILKVNGSEIERVGVLETVLAGKAARWHISIWRDGRILSVVVAG
jgi:Do/DeqQ family serine protease